MDELTAFLLARYDEAEATHRHAGEGRIAWLTHLLDNGELSHTTVAADHHDGYWCADGKLQPDPAFVLIVYDQAEALADIAAKRSIIGAYRDGAAELARQESTGTVDAGVRGGVTALRFVMTALAGKYSDHPDYPAKGLL